MGLKFYVIDLETSGLNSLYHETNEVSIIRCDDRVQLTEFIRCEYPERASMDALRVTNKTLADLQKGNSKDIAVDRINKFLAEDNLTPAHRCFIAHNYNFDKKFMHALYASVKQQCPVDLWLCTMALSKQYAKQSGINSKFNLQASCDLVGVKKIAQAHNSKVDSRNTFLLWKTLIEQKNMDYLPFIKSSAQIINSADEEPDMSILDD